MNERQAYTEKMKAKLDEWNADIDKLEAQAKNAEADAQIKFQQQLDRLKATRDDAAKRLRGATECQHRCMGDLSPGRRGGLGRDGHGIRGRHRSIQVDRRLTTPSATTIAALKPLMLAAGFVGMIHRPVPTSSKWEHYVPSRES